MSAEEFAAMKAEADFYIDQGLTDEAIKIYKDLLSAAPGDIEIENKLNSLKPDTVRAEDISVEIVQDVDPLPAAEAESSEPLDGDPVTPPATGLEEIGEQTPAPQTSADDDLQALFSQYEQPEDPIDYEARYAAGLDLKQQGLLEEAIKELKIAAKDPDNKLRNSTMLALCHMQAGNYPLAIAEFSSLLDSMTPEDSTYLHVKYELACAHTHNMDHIRAVELFSEVQAQDSDFKDVSAKLESLNAHTAQKQQPEHKPNRDRVSYI